MKLKDVVVQGRFCGLETVEECILNFHLHSMQMFPYNALEFEYRELKKDIEAYEAGNLELPWDEINERVAEDLKEYENWQLKHLEATDEEQTYEQLEILFNE